MSRRKGTVYNRYFGFREAPFNATPDPRFFYTNSFYQEAFASVLYGIEAKKGFIVITGEVGTGKTTLLRKLMRNVEPTIHTVFIFNTYLNFAELLQLILDELGIADEAKNNLMMIQRLNDYLMQRLKEGHIVALLIDEAQNLSSEALEGLRLLSNLETDKEKLLQIVLMGQPELEIKLNQPNLRQLRQRVALKYRLERLKDEEVGSYVDLRLRTVGYEGHDLFPQDAVRAVAFFSKGIPRLINILCDNALLIAYAASQKKVSAEMIREVARDLRLDPQVPVAKVQGPKPEVQRLQPQTVKIESNNGKAKGTVKAPMGTGFKEVLSINRGASQPNVVSPQIINGITTALIEAMGPMAPLVMRDQSATLGESLEAFPRARLEELVELVSHEILDPILKAQFHRIMFYKIRYPNTPKRPLARG